VGAEVRVWSNTLNAWTSGRITEIDGNLVSLEYGPGGQLTKTLPKGDHELQLPGTVVKSGDWVRVSSQSETVFRACEEVGVNDTVKRAVGNVVKVLKTEKGGALAQCRVDMHDDGDAWLPTELLGPLYVPGVHVRLAELKTKDLNGKTGTLIGVSNDSSRWEVKLADEENLKSVKKENLRLEEEAAVRERLETPRCVEISVDHPGLQKICGRYAVASRPANGKPAWAMRAQGPPMVLYSTTGGRWAVAEGTVAKSGESVVVSVKHDGEMPHKLSDWGVVAGGEHKLIAGIKVTEATEKESKGASSICSSMHSPPTVWSPLVTS